MLKYNLVQKKNIGPDATDVPEKLYARPVYNGYVSFTEICDDISNECTLTSADVKAVLDRTNLNLRKHLRAGRIVQFGELGNFRMSFGSSGAESEKAFDIAKIRKPRIVFTPGKMLTEARLGNSFYKNGKKKTQDATSPDTPSSPSQLGE